MDINKDDLRSSFQELAGIENEYFLYIENVFNVFLSIRNNDLLIEGNEKSVNRAARFIRLLDHRLGDEVRVDQSMLNYMRMITEMEKDLNFSGLQEITIARTIKGKTIKPMTLGQKIFYDKIKKHDLNFVIGPAGTGKTFLAVAYAVQLLKEKKIDKIILTRPAVEAGESLGFLPGDLKEKVDPYLRPLYDALDEMLSQERTEKYLEKGIIEIAPLAYMRGRTLDNAMIILDEAQNTSKSQMLMFLSRLGKNSKMIVNGDIQQIDLPFQQESGLIIAERYLKNIDEIAFVYLSSEDIVRHPLVVKIIDQFERGTINDKKSLDN